LFLLSQHQWSFHLEFAQLTLCSFQSFISSILNYYLSSLLLMINHRIYFLVDSFSSINSIKIGYLIHFWIGFQIFISLTSSQSIFGLLVHLPHFYFTFYRFLPPLIFAGFLMLFFPFDHSSF
jgi:hypothetical protein